MKNDKMRIFKYMMGSLFEVIISVILSMFLYWILYYVMYNLYISYQFPLINAIAKSLFEINDNMFIGNTYVIIGVTIFILIYGAITYKKYKSMSQIVTDLEVMSKGEFDNNIEVKSSGDIGQVAKNINEIVEKLKNITVEERKAQQTKTDLITNVSHDLRTPLTSIIGYLN